MAVALSSASVGTGGIGAAKLQAPSAATAVQPATGGGAAAERAITLFVIGRKTWLFSDTPKGAA